MILRPLPHDIAVFVILPRLRALIFKTLKSSPARGGCMKKTVFLTGAQKVDFSTIFVSFKKWQFSLGESSVLQNASSSVPNSWQSRGLQTVAVGNRREFCPAKRHQLCADFLAELEITKSGSFQVCSPKVPTHLPHPSPALALLTSKRGGLGAAPRIRRTPTGWLA